MSRLRSITLVILIVGVFVAGVGGGVFVDRFVTVAAASTTPVTGTPDTDLLLQAWRIISNNYVDRRAVDSKQLTYGAITGMVDALGDTGHSRFMSPEMVKQQTNYTNGSFEGIGAQIEKKGDYIIVTAPLDDSPALKAGLKPGDAIIKIDGEDVIGKTAEAVIGKVLGHAGTKVTLTILDLKTEQQRQVTITRARIVVNNVTWAQVPGTSLGVVRIVGFSDNVSDGLVRALTEMRAQKITGVILDLRNNPGGLLHEAVDTASEFLKDGNVLLQKDANGKIDPVAVKPGGTMTDLPMVVLINYGSASAAEIVAGALQDAGRAKLVGETTYGTGTVLNTFGLSDGSALLLATSQWLTPQGRVIWHTGIKPDIEVSMPVGAALLSPTGLKTLDASAVQASNDVQLKRAVELLTCPNDKCTGEASKTP